MAVNAVSQFIQLLPSPVAGNDLSLGLQNGDAILGRIVEMLPENKAVLQINNTNVIAQLPNPQIGQSFSNGSILKLTVTQANAGTQSGANAANSPSLVLKLQSPGNLEGTNAATLADSGVNISPSGLEGLLLQAQVSPNSLNNLAAQNLLQYGLPVSASNVQELVSSAQALLSTENPAAPSASNSKILAPELQTSLGEAKTMLEYLTTQSSPALPRPLLQGWSRSINDLLDGNASSNSSSQGPFQSAAEASQALQSALNQISDGLQRGSESLQAALSGIQDSLSKLQIGTDSTALSGEIPESELSNPGLSLSVLRETTHWILQQSSQGLELGLSASEAVTQASDSLSQAISSSGIAAQDILNSVQVQNPGSGSALEGSAGLGALQNGLLSIQESLSHSPLSGDVNSATRLRSAFAERGLPTPQASLSSFSQESLFQALGFLKARGMSPSRPSVELLASQFDNPQGLAGALQSVQSESSSLPQGFLALQPQLNASIAGLNQFLGQNGVQSEGDDLPGQLQNFVKTAGLELESSLRASVESSPGVTSKAQTGSFSDSLKGKLLQLNESLQAAAKSPLATASTELSQSLSRLSDQVHSALGALHASQLASKPLASMDVQSVQIPLTMNAGLNNSQISVFWRKGQGQEGQGDDPVQVVFLLNTRALGDVKVQLQVWKDDCRCKVSVKDEATKAFVQGEAAQFQKDFAANTPFTLSQLEFSSGAVQGQNPLGEMPFASSPSGLNLTA